MTGAAQVLSLAGRQYVIATATTLRQDQWVQARIASTGVLTLTKDPKESALDYANRIVKSVVESGLAVEIVAGLLTPVGSTEPWSEARAAKIAEELGNITDPQEKQAFLSQLSSLVAGFFAAGLQSLLTSRSYSSAAAAGVQPSPSPSEGS